MKTGPETGAAPAQRCTNTQTGQPNGGMPPEVTATFGSNYVFSNGLSIGGDVNYTSSTFSDSVNTSALENDAFWLVNLNANYVFENGAELTGYVRNLLDEEYATQISLADPSLNGLGIRREVGLLLTITF